MPQDYFDESVAPGYDASCAEMFDPGVLDPALAFLAELAGDGDVLEFGIGTGRVALPLRARGVQVHGIDLSPAMIEQLRAKPGGADVAVTVGDFAAADLGRTFRVVYLVFNTITNLTSQDDQVRAFRTAAAHLEPGGCFVVENSVPALRRLPPGETVHAFRATPTHLGFEEYDLERQIAVSHHYRVVEGRLEVFATPHRYVWPAELDLMALLAGMELRERWSWWSRTPFTADSTMHVSVCRRARNAGPRRRFRGEVPRRPRVPRRRPRRSRAPRPPR
jgi:SAM-dependent methyltransferase